MFKKYESNKIGTDYVCGDIHGCFSDLEIELEKTGFNKKTDRLFSVGDLTDRGPESYKVLDYITKDWFIPVFGNHEDMMIKCYLEKTDSIHWHWRNGGKWVENVSEEWLDVYLEKIISLPLIIQVGDYGIIHSLIPNGNWKGITESIEQKNQSLIYYVLWKRVKNVQVSCQGIKKIYAGHTIHERPVNYGVIEDIDTGAFLKYWERFNGSLTLKKVGE